MATQKQKVSKFEEMVYQSQESMDLKERVFKVKQAKLKLESTLNQQELDLSKSESNLEKLRRNESYPIAEIQKAEQEVEELKAGLAWLTKELELFKA